MTSTTPDADAVVIERVLDAPTDVVWRLWTDPVHFAGWYGPAGASVTVLAMDMRVGGRRHVEMAMETPNGPHRMFFVGEHLEIVEGTRLAYTESMADEAGNVLDPASMGMPAGHPATTRVVVELADAAPGRTRMVLTHHGIPAGSPGEMGWNMAFDKLEARLADAS